MDDGSVPLVGDSESVSHCTYILNRHKRCFLARTLVVGSPNSFAYVHVTAESELYILPLGFQ